MNLYTDISMGNDERGGDPTWNRQQRACDLWKHSGDLRVP